tara:strand:- start:6 stop:863 length:858 start_codon:yes stop_codon:yes gene_type:complete
MKKIINKSETYKIFKNSPKFSTKWSSYFQVYDQIFRKFKKKKIKFVEVGVANGGSLFIWKKYFSKNSRIIGIDLNPKAKELEKYGFEIFIGNQSDKNFWRKFYKKVGKIDVLLDDGGHKNLQQISTVHYSLPNINNDGIIVIEDSCTSYMKKEFDNPSKYSFINYCNLIIESIHRRCSALNRSLNLYSKKVFSLNFFESIAVFNINEKKCFMSYLSKNKAKNEWAIDYRNNEYFPKTKDIINKKFNSLNETRFFRKIIRKVFYKNFIFNIYENIKLKEIFKLIEK